MKPIAIHAFNPGPITGAGNWTWLIRGRVPTLIDAGTGDPQHLEALARALDGDSAGAGSRDARAHRSCIGRDGARRAISGRPVPEDAVAGARHEDGQSRGSRWTTAAPWQPGTRRSRRCTRLATRRIISASGIRNRGRCSGGDLASEGTTVWIPPNLQGDLAALPGVARARAGARSRRVSCPRTAR